MAVALAAERRSLDGLDISGSKVRQLVASDSGVRYQSIPQLPMASLEPT